jgi:hypothetical protein
VQSQIFLPTIGSPRLNALDFSITKIRRKQDCLIEHCLAVTPTIVRYRRPGSRALYHLPDRFGVTELRLGRHNSTHNQRDEQGRNKQLAYT